MTTPISLALEVRALGTLGTAGTAVTTPTTFEWDDPQHSGGSFKLAVQNDLVPGALTVDKAIVATLAGTAAFTVVVEDSEAVELAPGEDGAKVTTYTGRMLRTILDRGRVFPTLGYDRLPFADSRTFSFASLEYTPTGWGTATVLNLQSESSTYYDGLPTGWPDPNAAWVCPSVDTDSTGHEGHWYLIGDFTLAADATLVFFMAADNKASVFLDGLALTQFGTDLGFNETHRATVFASAGNHRIGVKVSNFLDGGADPPFGMGSALSGDPTAFLLSCYTVDGTGQLGPLVIHTDALWSILEYPSSPPGMTAMQAFGIMVAENQADGLLPDLVLDPSDTLDSNGNDWDTFEFITVDVGRSLFDVAVEWAVTYWDWDIPGPTDQTFYAWRWQERGTASGVSYTATTNPETSTLDRQRRLKAAAIADALIVRWAGGQLREPTSGGDKLGFIKLGRAASTDEARRVAAQWLAVYGIVQTMLACDVCPTGTGDVPYLDLIHGDTVTTGSDLERAVRFAGELTDNGAEISVFTKDLILAVEDRLDLAIRRMNDGTLGGTAPASPALEPPVFASKIQSSELTFSVPDPLATGMSMKTDAVSSSGNLFQVLAILNAASSSGTTDFEYLVGGVDVLNGAGSLGVGVDMATFYVDLGSSQFTQWLQGGVSRIDLNVTAVGTDAAGLVVKGVVL